MTQPLVLPQQLRTENFDGVGIFVPAGAVIAFGGTSAPDGFKLCNGQYLNASSNPEYLPLWGIIGTTYGGTSFASFRVPDLRGKVVGCYGTSPFTFMGQVQGSETQTLTSVNMPPHSHPGSSLDSVPSHSHGFTGISTSFEPDHIHEIETATSQNNTGSTNAATSGGVFDIDTEAAGGHSHSVSGSLDPAGGHTHSLTIASQGGGSAFSLLQPTITLQYIISLGI